MNETTSDKAVAAIKAKVKKHWDHDIEYIDGKFVEDVVMEYQSTKNEDILLKIIGNYAIFKKEWASGYLPYCDNDIEAGEAMFEEIIWNSAVKFDMTKTLKRKGKAFNAYIVSALLNSYKNHRSAKMSHKNHPRVKCPVCAEEVYQIDAKHLKHLIDPDRYKRMFPRYPLVSTDGSVREPITGSIVADIGDACINRVAGRYTVEDFASEFGTPKKQSLKDPVFGTDIHKFTSSYPASMMSGYTEADFVRDFPDFQGLITCPFSGKKMIEMTQEHLDAVLKPGRDAERYSMSRFEREYPNATKRAKRACVKDPYSGKTTKELTPEMLVKGGTTLKDHLETHAQILLDKRYPFLVTCPFTGRKTHEIKTRDLEVLGRNAFEFYLAVSKHPLKKWTVKCAVCGDYVDNIWTHLDQAEHAYASQIDKKERQTGPRNLIDLDRYKRMFPKYPLVSTDGMVSDPITGNSVAEISEAYVNRVAGRYTVEDFASEFGTPKKQSLKDPVFGTDIHKFTSSYPASMMSGYTEADFVRDFPDFPGLITCPFSGKKMIEMTQEHLDAVLKPKKDAERYSVSRFEREYPNATKRAKRASVKDPYSGRMVKELTPEMLVKGGTTLKDHLETHAQVLLDRRYPFLITCPFTGRKTKEIKTRDLEAIGRNAFEFYLAVSKHPLKKWTVKCAICGDHVDNIWTHLEEAAHAYAPQMDTEEYEKQYGPGSTKAVISTNAFYQSDSGDSVHVADLLVRKGRRHDPLELEDSLLKAAKDGLDKKIAKAVGEAHTLDDICFVASEKRHVTLQEPVSNGGTRAIKDQVRKASELDDFDIAEQPNVGAKRVAIMVPSRESIRLRVMRLLEESDIEG